MMKRTGVVGNRDVHEVEIGCGPLAARLSGYGARLTHLFTPDARGEPSDIVLGHGDLDGYLTADAFFGATCGRFGNRIASGRFLLDGVVTELDRNEGENHLHGGAAGFDKKVWRIVTHSPSEAVFAASSPAGEMGYPGTCTLTCAYRFESEKVLSITMEAQADAPTPINMVHHSYFNLRGEASADILDHEVVLPADTYLPVRDDLIPTGEAAEVAGTAFDFRTARPIGALLPAPPARGFDHNWCLRVGAVDLRPAADVRDPVSGRRLRLRTNQPGVQFYTGGYLSGAIVGKGGVPLKPFAGFTLETQAFPDAPNQPGFPSAILRPGQTYRHLMEFTFDAG